MRANDAGSEPREDTDQTSAAGYGARRGIDIGAVISSVPVMWLALGEASEFLQFVLVALGVSAFSATRTRLAFPFPFALPRFSRLRR